MKPEFIVCDQGTQKWKDLKLAVISASNISRGLAKKGSETRTGYIMELVGQVATREFDEVNAKSLEWGRSQEEASRAAYEFHTGNKVDQVGFIYSPCKRFGVSPDGIMPGISKGLELKNPLTAKVHADFLCNDKIKSEYFLQVQFQLYVSRYQSWDFASYHPKFKSSMIKVKTFEPDRETFERFDNELPIFIKEVDEALEKIQLKWGQQWL